MKSRIIHAVIAVGALGLIAYGGHLAWKPLGFLLPGLALWIDISRIKMKGGD